MRLTASIKPRKQVCAYEKCARIRKVHLITRVYGNMSKLHNNASYSMHLFWSVTLFAGDNATCSADEKVVLTVDFGITHSDRFSAVDKKKMSSWWTFQWRMLSQLSHVWSLISMLLPKTLVNYFSSTHLCLVRILKSWMTLWLWSRESWVITVIPCLTTLLARHLNIRVTAPKKT